MIRLETSFRWTPGRGPSAVKREISVAHQALDTQVIMRTEPFVPFRTGHLNRSVSRGAEPGEIRYDVPYARRCYRGEGFDFRRTFHPQATHHWLEKAKAVYMPEWTRIVVNILAGRARGR